MTEPMKRRRYRNPPIEEALVELHMAPGQEWDLTIPGKVHEKVKAAYPGKPREQKLVQAAFQAAPGQPAGFSVHEGLGRVQLVDEGGRRLLSLGPNVLSVNVLKPYDGWDAFRPRIDQALRAYAAVSGACQVSRVGVRYINRVSVPGSDFAWSDYFLCGPSVTPGLPRQISGFLSRAEHVFEDGVQLLLTFATIGGDTKTSAFLMDLDVIWEGSALDIDNALAKVDVLHDREGAAFESLITDKARELFDAT